MKLLNGYNNNSRNNYNNDINNNINNNNRYNNNRNNNSNDYNNNNNNNNNRNNNINQNRDDIDMENDNQLPDRQEIENNSNNNNKEKISESTDKFGNCHSAPIHQNNNNNVNNNNENNGNNNKNENSQHNFVTVDGNNLNNSELHDLEEFKFNERYQHDVIDNDKCLICNLKFKGDDIIKKLQCAHIYHKYCLSRFSQSQIKNENFPICLICLQWELQDRMNHNHNN